MGSCNQIRVIKRAQCEPPNESPTGGGEEISGRENAKGPAETVREWVSEFRRTRQARCQEAARQLDRLQDQDNCPGLEAEAIPRTDEN